MKIVLRGGGKKIVLRQTGRRGPAGAGLPTGGTTGEVLTKTSNTDYDTEWAPVPSAPVDSVNGQTGVVVLDASDVGADPAGSAAQALSDANDYTDSAVAGVDTGVMTVVAGNNVTVDSTDPANPVVSAADAPVDSVNGQTGVVTLGKADVGLSNVDNTSDLAKPISTATQTALNLKLDASRLLQGVGFPNGTVTAPVGTIYVDTAVTNGASLWVKKSGTGNTGWRVLEGDTGWRDVTSLFTNLEVVNENDFGVFWKRKGDLAYVKARCQIKNLSTSPIPLPLEMRGPASNLLGPAPFRFNGQGNVLEVIDYVVTGVSMFPVPSSAATVGTRGFINGTYDLIASQQASWPSTLPGTAV